ncbi:MAG: hypothetical protein JOY64_26890 [Alphaproteobacteria bacterium]|nr:hypothetical protein [Alphaproteobacteria bacterium]MBV8411284.1 hypothetical protein [Alphaproteobacteria bacterium]
MRLARAIAAAGLLVVASIGNVDAADPETPASPSHTPTWQAEAWYFYRSNPSDLSQQQRLTLRFYQRFFFAEDWQLTLREDIRGLDTNKTGVDNPTGAWQAHLGDMFTQAALKTPEMAPGLRADLGIRVLYPTGDLPPYSKGRYQIGPHFGLIWDVPNTAGVVVLAPLVRYMQSVGDQPPHSTPTSDFQLHPIIAIKPGTWGITLWREHPWILDALTNRWFIPLDAMVTHEVVPHLSLGVGVAVGLVNDSPRYNNIIYGRIAFSF